MIPIRVGTTKKNRGKKKVLCKMNPSFAEHGHLALYVGIDRKWPVIQTSSQVRHFLRKFRKAKKPFFFSFIWCSGGGIY